MVEHLPRLPEDNNDDGFMALQWSSPRCFISRWLSTLKRGKRRQCDAVRSQKRPKGVAMMERETREDSTHAICSMNRLNGGGEETKPSKQIRN
ncbi:hypothetical protein ACFX13_019147 [Malus domestica]